MIWIVIVLLGLYGLGLSWFCFELLLERIRIIKLIKEFFPVVKDYEDHLDTLSKMEMYYADPTIEEFVRHTKTVSESLNALLETIEVVEEKADNEEE